MPDPIVGRVDEARALAVAPVSGFEVGAVLRGRDGRVALGANFEIRDLPLFFTVHAEQAAVHQAVLEGIRGIDLLAVSEPPCGHCRQFLCEHDPEARLSIGEDLVPLSELLPSTLDAEAVPAAPPRSWLPPEDLDEASTAAAACALLSHARWSGEPAGVALLTSEGAVARGAYLESVAFNPSLPAISAALSDLRLRGGGGEISRAVLATVPGSRSHEIATRAALGVVAPSVALEVVRLRSAGG